MALPDPDVVSALPLDELALLVLGEIAASNECH